MGRHWKHYFPLPRMNSCNRFATAISLDGVSCYPNSPRFSPYQWSLAAKLESVVRVIVTRRLLLNYESNSWSLYLGARGRSSCSASEWQSNLKWDRLVKEISPLESRRVLDVGSGNGYYGFRMLAEGAEMVLGIDPHVAYVAQFWLLKHFAAESPVFVLPLTLEQIPPSLNYFDTVFSMGVIYHRRSPIDHILELKSCLRPGGELVIESICVDGEAGYSLTPEKKYARMGNVWFIPSIPTLVQWLTRCSMEQISVIDESTTTVDEQRKTEWMPFDSLEDALDVNNPQLTIEGLPAPKRVVVKAIRP